MKASQKTGLHDFDGAKPGDRFCLFVLFSPVRFLTFARQASSCVRAWANGFIVKKIACNS